MLGGPKAETKRQAKDGNKWIYVVLPYQIAYGPISTLVVLYILHLGGTVIDVAYAFTLSNVVSIPAAIFWSELVNKMNKRKFFLLTSFAGLALSLWALFVTQSIPGVIAIYSLLSFIVTANATPMNLLVMETNKEKKWADSYSRLQLLSSVGSTIGLVFATVIAGLLSLQHITLILLAFALVSLAMTVTIVKDPRSALRRKAFIEYHPSFISRLTSFSLLFLRRPRLSTTKEVLSRIWSKKYALSLISVLFTAQFVYYLGSSLFNTAYLAGLKVRGVNISMIFLIVLVSSVLQTIAYLYTGKITDRGGEKRTAWRYLLLRGVCYAGMGISFVLFGAFGILGTNIFLYPIAAGLAYAGVLTATSTMLFKAIKDNKPARALGIYSSLVGIGSLIGSLAAGYLSYYVGYWFTFLLAGMLVTFSAYMFFKMKNSA